MAGGILFENVNSAQDTFTPQCYFYVAGGLETLNNLRVNLDASHCVRLLPNLARGDVEKFVARWCADHSIDTIEQTQKLFLDFLSNPEGNTEATVEVNVNGALVYKRATLITDGTPFEFDFISTLFKEPRLVEEMKMINLSPD